VVWSKHKHPFVKLPNDPVFLKVLLKEKESKEEMWKEQIKEKEERIKEKQSKEEMWKEQIKEKERKEEMWKEQIKDKERYWKAMESHMEEKIMKLNTEVLALKRKSGGMDAYHTSVSSSQS